MFVPESRLSVCVCFHVRIRYMSPLYRGLTGRPKQKVIDVSPKNDIVSELILRAIPEALAVGTPKYVTKEQYMQLHTQTLVLVLVLAHRIIAMIANSMR